MADLLLELFSGSAGPITGSVAGGSAGAVWQPNETFSDYPIVCDGAGSGGPTTTGEAGFYYGSNYVDIPIAAGTPEVFFRANATLPLTSRQITIYIQPLEAEGVLVSGSPGVQHLCLNATTTISCASAGTSIAGDNWYSPSTVGASEAWVSQEHEFGVRIFAPGGTDLTVDSTSVATHSTYQFAPNDGTNFTCWGFRITFTIQGGTDVSIDSLGMQDETPDVGPYPEGTKPDGHPDALLYDDFGVLYSEMQGWTPDYNAAANAAWIESAGNYSPRAWTIDSGLLATDGGWVRAVETSPGYIRGNMYILHPGEEELPASLYVEPIRIVWKLRFNAASSTLTGSGYEFWFRLGGFFSLFAYRTDAVPTNIALLMYGTDDYDYHPIEFEEGQEIDCEAVLGNGEAQIKFGSTQFTATLDPSYEVSYGYVGVELFSPLVELGSILIERAAAAEPQLFWTGKVNTVEVL